MKALPSADGSDDGSVGRNAENGQFVKGWKGGPGGKVGTQRRYKEAMLRCVTEKTFEDILGKVISAAKKGEAWALKEMLDRTLGKASQPIEGILGVYAVQPTDEDVAAAAEIIGRRLTYGQATATR